MDKVKVGEKWTMGGADTGKHVIVTSVLRNATTGAWIVCYKGSDGTGSTRTRVIGDFMNVFERMPESKPRLTGLPAEVYNNRPVDADKAWEELKRILQ